MSFSKLFGKMNLGGIAKLLLSRLYLIVIELKKKKFVSNNRKLIELLSNMYENSTVMTSEDSILKPQLFIERFEDKKYIVKLENYILSNVIEIKTDFL